MNPTAEYIKKLSDLKEGEHSQLRSLAGRPLDETVQGFDLFSGLWWPLRAKNPATPRREPSWLVAKLFGSFRVPHIRPDSGAGPSLPEVLGCCEPHDEDDRRRFRDRFDALLCSSLSSLEPHLRWAMGEAARAVAGHVPHARNVKGIDWVQLLDDLSIWDRGKAHRRRRDVRDIWAETYLNTTDSKERRA
ncbi:MAG TPA: type I-E CRISPR-associated protein Cse2/CasB [Anaerohalosphaeraceae bacterium]|nr:type I-E CRISPR-associated protein Cse2/CasB [Anaerohalosphaeraceae bacterium]